VVTLARVDLPKLFSPPTSAMASPDRIVTLTRVRRPSGRHGARQLQFRSWLQKSQDPIREAAGVLGSGGGGIGSASTRDGSTPQVGGLSLSFNPLTWGLSLVAACRRDMARPLLDHLRVRSTDLEDTRRWP
jgi:hypothetical protein